MKYNRIKFMFALALSTAVGLGALVNPWSESPASAAVVINYGYDYTIKVTAYQRESERPARDHYFTIDGLVDLPSNHNFVQRTIRSPRLTVGSPGLNTATIRFHSATSIDNLVVLGNVHESTVSSEANWRLGRSVPVDAKDHWQTYGGGQRGAVIFSVVKEAASSATVDVGVQLYDAHNPGEDGALEVISTNSRVNGSRMDLWSGSRERWNSATKTTRLQIGETGIVWSSDIWEADLLNGDDFLGRISATITAETGQQTLYAIGGEPGCDAVFKVTKQQILEMAPEFESVTS